MRFRCATLALASLLLLAGCSDGKECVEEPSEKEGAVATSEVEPAQQAAKTAPMRKEFVLLRELVRQHDLQQGNEKRIEAIETALKSKFPLLPDHGETEEEKRVFSQAERLMAENTEETRETQTAGQSQ